MEMRSGEERLDDNIIMKKGSSSQAVAMSKHRARLLFTVIYEDAV